MANTWVGGMRPLEKNTYGARRPNNNFDDLLSKLR
jgi:hypothetical protein